MKRLLLIGLVIVGVTALLSACNKPVEWEEEVPLNTGETIWVKRTVLYTIQGGAGNPLDIAYRPEQDQSIEFTWGGKQYHYKGNARIMVLAISPSKKPVLVAKAPDNSWDARHGYACSVPFYVQLMPAEDGRSWHWPPQIEPWLYNLPGNLLLARHSPNQMKKRYSTEQRAAENQPGSAKSPSQQGIDPAYTGDLCKKKEE